MQLRSLTRLLFGSLTPALDRWRSRPRRAPLPTEASPGDPEATWRAARRMMELLGCLHERGYGGLRLRCGLSPSGCHWRASVHAARASELGTKSYSTGAGPRVLFDWEGVEAFGLAELADRFLAQFPEVAAAAHHPDPAYLRWYRDMLDRTAPRGLVYCSADFPLPVSGVGVLGCDCPEGIPPPPPP